MLFTALLSAVNIVTAFICLVILNKNNKLEKEIKEANKNFLLLNKLLFAKRIDQGFNFKK